jgi:hypothetical protein
MQNKMFHLISFDHHIGGYASLTKPLILPACQSLVRRAGCIFIPHDEDPMHNAGLTNGGWMMRDIKQPNRQCRYCLWKVD